jgi:hypothetical protein
MLCNIWGSHGRDYEECLLLGLFIRSLLKFLVTANVPSSLILFSPMMEALLSSETSVLTEAAWCHIIARRCHMSATFSGRNCSSWDDLLHPLVSQVEGLNINGCLLYLQSIFVTYSVKTMLLGAWPMRWDQCIARVTVNAWEVLCLGSGQ